MDRKAQLRPETPQQIYIAPALMAKGKVFSHTDRLDRSEIVDHFANELLARQFAERFIEINQQHRIRSQRFESPQALGQGINERRDAMGGDDGARVLPKRHDQGLRSRRSGVANSSANDLLVPEMNAVKKADGHAHG